MNRRLFIAIASALGVTTICCLWIVGPLVSTTHYAVYHWSGPASTLFVPAFVDFVVFWIAITIILLNAQGSGRKPVVVWGAILMVLPWAFLKNWSLLGDWNFPHWLSRSFLGMSLAAFLVLVTSWRPAHQRTFERVKGIAVSLLCSIAVFGASILIQLVWFGWQARSLNAPHPLHQTAASANTLQAAHPRIIWILFDELSYQQVYGKRFPGLHLPAFDSLASESTVFTHAVAAGNMTEIVMPSLMSGIPIDKIHSFADGKNLIIHRSKEKRWAKFDQHETVFQDALNAGYITAVTGWYNPYCRILSDVLDRCTWVMNGLVENKSMPRASILRNILQPILTSFLLLDRLHTFFTHEPKAVDFYAALHIADYQELSASADRTLEDPSANFILLHMPVPHPGGIYNRTTRNFAIENSSYIDNLALADSYLSHVRSLLESRGQWDSSVVVVMGDHSWRTTSWSAAPDWTHEEQIASDGGVFDARPAYIVKAPFQKTGVRIDMPFPAVDTRLMLDAFLHRQITSAETLYTWVERLNKNYPNQSF
jgi:hypothetical protein